MFITSLQALHVSTILLFTVVYSRRRNHRNMSPSSTYYWQSPKHIRMHHFIRYCTPQQTTDNALKGHLTRTAMNCTEQHSSIPKHTGIIKNDEIINAAPEFVESITHQTFPYTDYWRGYWMESRLEDSKISRRLVTIPGKANNSVNNFAKLRESSVRGCAWWLHRRISTRK